MIATKGTSYGHLEHREAEPVRLLGQRGRHLCEVEADPEAESREPVLRQPPHVGPLAGGQLTDAEPGGEQELAAFEPLGRVLQLRDVQPADLAAEPLRACRDPQIEARQSGDVADAEHRDWTSWPKLRAWTPGCNALRGQPGTNHLAKMSKRDRVVWTDRPLSRSRAVWFS